MVVFFPGLVQTAKGKTLINHLHKKTLLQLRRIKGQEVGDQIQTLEDQIMEMTAPVSFSGKGSFEVQMVKGFEEAVVMLSQHMSINPREMTVLRFFQALESITKQNKKRSHGKSH